MLPEAETWATGPDVTWEELDLADMVRGCLSYPGQGL